MITTILMVLAVICFLLAAMSVNFPNSRINTVATGLFFWALAILIGSLGTIGLTIKK